MENSNKVPKLIQATTVLGLHHSVLAIEVEQHSDSIRQVQALIDHHLTLDMWISSKTLYQMVILKIKKV